MSLQSVVMLSALFLLVTPHAKAYNHGGTLPIPAAPREPVYPTVEAIQGVDPQRNQALARLLAEVAELPARRQRTRGAQWRVAAPEDVLQPEDAEACLAHLAADGASFIDLRQELSEADAGRLLPSQQRYVRQQRSHFMEHVPTPVILLSPVADIAFVDVNGGPPLLVACAFARRIVELARVWAALGVVRAGMLSAHRDHPHESFHTRGFALDVSWVERADGRRLTVSQDFQRTADVRTCSEGEGSSAHAHALAHFLRGLACSVAGAGRFSTVLTPNYNEGHRDHFHFDARPYDPRLFTR